MRELGANSTGVLVPELIGGTVSRASACLYPQGLEGFFKQIPKSSSPNRTVSHTHTPLSARFQCTEAAAAAALSMCLEFLLLQHSCVSPSTSPECEKGACQVTCKETVLSGAATMGTNCGLPYHSIDVFFVGECHRSVGSFRGHGACS
eukprot:3734708-Amphidinium_carterae.1